MEWIAHIRSSDGRIQTVEEHLRGVRELAESYGARIGVKHIAGLAGVLHDMGKFTEAFRTYILEAVRNPDAPPRRGSVDHATAGGRLLHRLYHSGEPSSAMWRLAEVVGNAIISHHSYLHDFLAEELESPYLKRVQDKQLEEYEEAQRRFFERAMSETEFLRYAAEAVAELETFLKRPFAGNRESKLMFLSKYIFSALIDADRTNTRLFEEDKAAEPEESRKALFESYYVKLMDKIRSFREPGAEPSPIDALRQDMSEQCERFAAHPSGIYTLSIPTGGGKTLASLRYALQHAIQYGKRSIVYVVPYTTIIEQNADEVRRILRDDEHILEHHSNVVDDADDDDEQDDGRLTVREKLRLARDNWDAPIIFTTMVQFLNVFYAKGSRNIRRLHRLSEAVVIFDEVQKVPVHCVSLFNQALNFLRIYGRSSLVLCTATQPALDFVKHKLEIDSDAEMISDLKGVIRAFKRVEICDYATGEAFDNDKLAAFIRDKLNEVRSVLVIMNTKTVVRKLYQMKTDFDCPVYHLSTSMCAAHRNEVLDLVRGHLEREERVLCISTQLIEAGVNISFDCVIRSLAGLDSIAQAAGRCNRHGKQGIQNVYVIDHAEENLRYLKEIAKGKELARKIFVDLRRDSGCYGGHILSGEAMERYFKEFYSAFESSLDLFVPKLRKNITDLLFAGRKSAQSYHPEYMNKQGKALPLLISNSYRTAAEHFRVIDDRTTSVLVPYDDVAKEVIAELSGGESIDDLSRLLRRAQLYSINLFRYERDQLAQNGGLVSLLDGKVLALQESAYSKEYGLELDNDGEFELGMI